MLNHENSGAFAQISDTLRRRYGLHNAQISRIQIGQGTKNYRAVLSNNVVFVKRYLPGTDIDEERGGIRLSELAAQAGIPVASIIPNKNGEWIDLTSDLPMSVWEWVEGSVKYKLCDEGYAEIGHALGVIHRTFAKLPESSLPAEKTIAWRQVSVSKLNSRLSNLRALVEQKVASGNEDDFDRNAKKELAERQLQLLELPNLLTDLPSLTSQVLHGDYSLANLLFNRSQISAVLDFRPPSPFMIAYELGRIAFDPRTVNNNTDWLRAADKLTRAYLEQNPCVPQNDIVYSGRVAMIQLLKSLYGVKQHYVAPGLLQYDLDEFWRMRHRAVKRLVKNTLHVDEMLRSIAAAQ